MLNKEVKVILNLVRMKGKSLRPKFASILTAALISGLLVSIPIPANAAACVPTSTTAANGETILIFSTVGGCDWKVPTGVTKAQVLIVAGGGGGGDSKVYATGGGGGAGGYFQANNVSISGTIAITIGAGGAGGANNTAATSTSRGTAGGDTSFGSLKVGGGGGGNSWNYTLGTAALSGNGGSTYLTGGNGGGARSRPNGTSATQNGGSGGAHSSAGILFLGATLTGNSGVAGNNSNIGDFATGGTGGSISSADRTSSITGSAYEYSKPGPFKWAAGAQTYGSGGDTNYLGATDGAGGGAGFKGVVIVRYLADCSPTRTTTDSDYVYTFTTVGQCGWSAPAGVTSFDALIVGGGGGGGSSLGGGGGGGQVVSQTGITLDTSATIWIGPGGSGGNGSFNATTNHGKKGSSTLIVSGSSNYTALGGSGGNGRMSATNLNADGTAISTGYTGGGGAYPNGNSGTAIAGTGGNTYKGGNGTTVGGGGGGGAGGAGVARDASSNASSGGVGVSSDISGAATFYGGGGGASWYSSKTNWTGAGGTGGGGQGSDGNVVGGNGVANTGGGGGGAYDGLTGGNGGSGVVIIRHARAPSTISYDANGGNASAPTSQSQSAAGDQITLATYSGTKNSMRFMNWNTAADGSGTNYAAGEAVRPFSNITLYAQWMGTYCPEGWTWTEPVCSKSYTGVQNFIIPWGFRSLDVIALGGSGANGAKGAGGFPGKAHASYAFSEGDNIRFYPGAAGSGINGGVDSYPNENYNGGAGLTNNGGSGGGGAGTVVTKNGTTTSTIIIVAGGGGGGGANSGCGSQFNQESAAGQTTVSSNGFTYGSGGINHGYNRYSGGGGGGTNGGNGGTATPAYSCGGGNDQGGHGRGGFRGGNTLTGAATTIVNGANTSGGTAGSVTLQLTRPKITYNLNGGSGTTPASQVQTSEGEDLNVTSTVPVRTGYTFGGWNTLAAGTGTNYSANAVYNTNAVLNLFAKWTANSYNVIYDTSTVTSGTMANTALTAGTAFTLRDNTFAQNGYTFKNWNTVADGSGTTYTNKQSITLYGDLTLYPQWTLLAPGAPTLTTEAGNTEVTVIPTAAATSTTIGPASSILITAYNSTGGALPSPKTCTVVSPATSCLITGLTNGTTYQFGATAINAAKPAGTASASKVNGIPAGVAVTYNATSNGGTSGTASATYSKPSPLTLPIASKDGFTFAGWYNAATGGTLIGGAGGNYSPNLSTSIVKRSLASNIATLTTATPHGLLAGMSVIVINVNSTFNGSFTIADVPTSTTFTYAKTASNVTEIAVSPVGKATVSALTVYAQFVGNTYAISYNGNGNTGGTVPANGSYQAGGSSYTILGGTNSPAKVGYTFDGWYTNSTGTGGTSYAVGASYSTTNNLNLFAKWTVASRSVAYALDGGSSTATTTTLTGKVVGNTITLPAANTMSKTGYVFAGWSDGTTTYAGGATWTVPASDNNFTLTAQWTTQTLSYSYDTNGGGTAPAGGTKTYGQSLVLEPSTGLSKTGYTFTGWNDGSTTHLAGATISLTASKVFVAQWSAQSYSITYEGNGANSGSVTAGSYVAGGVPYAIAANGFTKTGYTFAGWKDASNNSFVVGAGYSTAANLVLTAQWTATSFTITYNSNGATSGSSSIASETWTFSPTTPLTLSSVGTLAKTGFTFSNWATTANATTGLTSASPTVNTTYYAVWTATQYTVTYAPGTGASGSISSPGNKTLGQTFTLDSGSTLTPPAASGSVTYSFGFWSDTTKTYKGGATYVMPAANVILTANWIAIYNVTYNPNGGVSSIGSSQKFVNEEITIGVAATRTGYNFVKWEDQSLVLWNPGDTTTVTAGRFLFNAQWSAKNNTISFDGNNNTGGSVPENGTYTTDGAAYVIPGNPGSLVRTGYTFIGWNTLANGTGTDYPAGVGSTYSAPADLALFAKWQANTYLISYNGNGATGGTAPGNGTYVTGAVNPYTVSTNSGTLAKTGFTFDNWYTTSTGSGGTAYTAGSGTLTTTSDLILYAKWSAASYTVSYASGDNAVSAPSQSTNAYGSSFTLPNALTRTGYTFLGWELGSGADANLYAAASTFTMGSSAITFTAKWGALSYVIVYSLNGGSGSTPSQANVQHNQDFTTAAAPTRSGFTFAGWSDGATTTSASTSISNVTSNKTLTAQWTIAVPGTPGTPTATPGNGGATITITPPSSGGTPSSYTVTALDSSGNPLSPAQTCTVVSPGTSCSISPLTNGTEYKFSATASNTTGTSAAASSASSAVTPASAPSAPLGVAGSGTGASATVTWSAPSDNGGSAVTDYIVEYRVATSGTWTTFTDGVSTTTSTTVTGLSAGSSYEFRVTAKNLIGNSLASFTSPVVETLPTAPSITGVTAASGQVTVAWNAPTHLGSGTLSGDEYIVTAYDSQGNEAGTCEPTSGQRSCVVTGLDNGSAYTFKVEAVTTVGNSEKSSASSAATPSTTPSAPSDVVAVTSGSNMTVTFTAPADNGGAAITSYVITSSPVGATCSVGANATTYTCTGLTAGANYTFTVKAVNVRGESTASQVSTAVTAIAVPSAPQNVSAVITAGSTTLSATVSFDPPATDNGSSVLSYTVTASPGGATCTVTAPDLYCDIPVLPDSLYTFTARATNAVGTSVASVTSLQTAAANGIAPSLEVDPAPAPTGTLEEGSTLTSVAAYVATPNAVVSYTWKRCTDQFDNATCTTISGAISATYVLTSADVDKFIRVQTTGTNSIGSSTNLSDATEVIVTAPVAPTPSTPSTPSAPVPEPSPAPVTPSCDTACQAIKDAAASKAAADAAAKAAADKLAADAAAKLKADAAATTASTKANADAAAAAAAAKAAVEKAAAAEAAKIAAEAAAASAAAKAKAAADAQAAANKAAATAAAALKNSAASAAAKAAATASAQKAAADAAAAVKAAATAAQQAATAKNSAANANKQVDIAINSLNSKTAASQASAQANAIAAAAKAAANEAAAAAAAKASEAKATATAAQKAAADTAARIATEQKEAATAAAAAKAAADAAAKATAEKIAATNAAKTASENLLKVLEEKATLADQAAKTSDENVRAEIAKKLEEIEVKAVEAEKIAEEATAEADDAVAEYEEAIDQASEASEVAETQAAEAVAVKAESVAKTAIATKAAAAATVAAKVATAAKAAAAKVPSKAVIKKPATSTTKNSAKATVTGLKPGQKVKVTVNVRPKP